MRQSEVTRSRAGAVFADNNRHDAAHCTVPHLLQHVKHVVQA